MRRHDELIVIEEIGRRQIDDQMLVVGAHLGVEHQGPLIVYRQGELREKPRAGVIDALFGILGGLYVAIPIEQRERVTLLQGLSRIVGNGMYVP
jgi:hypothetical protein